MAAKTRTFAEKKRKKFDVKAFDKKMGFDPESKRKLLNYLVENELFLKLNIDEDHLESGAKLPTFVEGILEKTFSTFNIVSDQSAKDFLKAFYNSDRLAKIALLYGALKGIDVTDIGTVEAEGGDFFNPYGYEVEIDPKKGVTFYEVEKKRNDPLGFIETFLLDRSELTLARIKLNDINDRIRKLEAKEVNKVAMSVEGFLSASSSNLVTIGKNKALDQLREERKLLEHFIREKQWDTAHVQIKDLSEKNILKGFLKNKSISGEKKERLVDAIREDNAGDYNIRLIDATDIEAIYEFLHTMISYYAHGVENASARQGKSKEFFQKRRRYFHQRMRKHKEGIADIITKYKPAYSSRNILDN